MLLILITYNYTLLVRCNRTLHQPQSFNPWPDLELTKAPWLALTNELWVIFIELFRESDHREMSSTIIIWGSFY